MKLRFLALALCLSLPATSARATMLRVLTYNIHHAVGTDGNLNLNRIANVINAANPDIVSLQEVDNDVPRSGNVNQMSVLGQLTGMQHYFGQARNLNGGHQGNGVLVRNGINILSTTNHQLPNPDNVEPRRVIEMDLSLDDNSSTTEFKFFATHLAHNSSSGRFQSVQHINSLVNGSSVPAILAGDFNFNPGTPSFNTLDNKWTDLTNVNNSGKNRNNQIDYIFYRQPSQWNEITQSQFILNSTTNVASDHDPLLGVLELPTPWPDDALVWNVNQAVETSFSDGFATGNGDQQVGYFPASPWSTTYNTGEQNLIIGYNANATFSGAASRTVGSLRIGTDAAAPIISGRNGDAVMTASGSVSLTIADAANTTGDLTLGEGGYEGALNWNSSGTLDVQGRLRVGQGGDGTMNQTGGVVTSDALVVVGDNAAGDGEYDISGGALATATDGSGAFQIGNAGATGTLTVSGSASVSHGAELYVGASSGSTGRLELIGSTATMQIGQLANADGADETFSWQVGAGGVTPLTVTGAGPLGANRVQLQSTTEAAANTGSGSTLSGDGAALDVSNLQSISGSTTLTLINNQTADAVTGYFENPNVPNDLYEEGAALLGTGYAGAVRVSYAGGTGNDVVLNMTDFNADPRLIVRLKADDVAGADGAAVSTWADAKTGDSFAGTVSQAASSARPVKRTGVLNGHAAVEFDGVNDVLLSSQTNSLPTVGNGVTVIMVATSDQGGDFGERAAQLGRSDGAAGRVVGMDLSSTDTSISNGGTGYRFNNGSSLYDANIDDTDFHIIVFQVDHNASYADAKVFVDGTQTANFFTGDSSNGSGTTLLNGSTLELLLGTGRLNGGGLAPNDYYGGQIAEFLVYNDQMSIDDVNVVADHLSFKYNLPFAFSFNEAGGGGSIPEPTTVCLLAIAGVLHCIRRRTR